MKILVCVDLSKSTEIIIDKIEELSKPLSARVWLLHNALPEPDKVEFKVDPIAARESLAKRFHVEHVEIQKLAERLRKAGVETTALACAVAPPASGSRPARPDISSPVIRAVL